MGVSKRVVVASVLAMAVVGAAWGQVQVQQTNPLDANPQLNSGGSNTPVPGYAPINGNNIVTGNVSGLKYFHTAPSTVVAGPNGSFTVVQNNNLGTFSPYEFQGNLGSANFFNFARMSSGGSQTNIGQTQAYYLPSSTVSTGQGSLYSAPYGNGYDSALAPSYAVHPNTPYGSEIHDPQPLSTGIAIRQFSATPANPTAQGPDLSGNLASPLFGVRSPGMMPQGGTPGETGTGSGTGNDRGMAPRNGNESPNSQDNGKGNGNNASHQDGGNGLSADAQVKSRPTGGTGDANRDNTRGEDRGLASTTYRTLLQRLQDAEKQAESEGTAGTDGGAKGGTNDVTAANGANGAAGSKGTENANGGRTGVARNGEKGTAGQNGMAGGAGQGTDVTGRPAIDPRTGRPVTGRPGEASLTGMGSGTVNSAGVRAGTGFGNGVTPGGNEDAGTAGGTGAGSDRGMGGTSVVRSGAMGRTGLEETPTSRLQAGKKVPALKSLVEVPMGGKVTPFDELMRGAEVLLKGGKYLEAADAYQTAITTEPDNALAVIGRGQAELGAGMYQSAANDLQFVFTKKPELMGVHYPVGDYLPAERQNFLIKDLQGLSTNRGPGNTASFLLCYMFYNTGRSEDVQAELGRWGNRAWRDSWQGVAGRAWGK